MQRRGRVEKILLYRYAGPNNGHGAIIRFVLIPIRCIMGLVDEAVRESSSEGRELTISKNKERGN